MAPLPDVISTLYSVPVLLDPEQDRAVELAENTLQFESGGLTLGLHTHIPLSPPMFSRALEHGPESILAGLTEGESSTRRIHATVQSTGVLRACRTF